MLIAFFLFSLNDIPLDCNGSLSNAKRRDKI